ncbi:phage minor head protein [Streptomyces sp. NPDC053560]|uniref:phage minor head protein n=1 Tax=Streptomyces sp. NPDC053560 TaxID=3365711 RepID=UPI0037CD430E
MPERDTQLEQAERDFADAVADALTATADEFTDAVRDATELVAARFSVGRIARMWRGRVDGLIRRLLGIAETAATAAAEDAGGELPDGWDDLPGRYDDRRALPHGISQYVETTEHLLRAVGDRLAEAARRELAAGVDAGEDTEQLRARLRAAFDREGSHLGPMREERVARTEATRAWNTSTLAAARAATGPDRPVVKQWITRHDDRVRHAHDEVDGQVQLLADPFTVAGVSMQAPGDPTAPPSLVVNCRCRLAVEPQLRADASTAFHGTRGRPSYRKYHPSGRNKKKRGLTRVAGGWLGSDRFTEEEHLNVLGAYNGLSFRGMNGVLRHGEDSKEVTGPRHLEEVRHQISALTDLIDAQEPTTAARTLYRGMRAPRRPPFTLNEGDEFHDRGFVSTTSEQRTAQSLAGNDERSIMFTIIAPAGSQMADMNGLRDLRSTEEEFILPPGSKFRVRRVLSRDLEDEDDSGPAHYELEVINAMSAAVNEGPQEPGSLRYEPTRRTAASVRAATGGNAFEERLTWMREHLTVDKRAKAAGRPDVTAAADPYTGAMIALMPCAEDALRLALDVEGAEPAHELHLTLFYLGEGADWSEDQRADLIGQLQHHAGHLDDGPVHGRAFGANQWNADGDNPCWVWSVGDDPHADEGPMLDHARNIAVDALADTHRQPELPVQHSPWQPHVCAAYSDSSDLLPYLNERLGPIRFDRLRVAFAGEHTDIPLGPEEEAPPMEDEETQSNGRLSARPWSTPGDTALAFENTETGDGRVFKAGALYWEGGGPWPLQHADEMLMGHEGAELAGAIQSIARDGDRITGSGVLYPGRPAGADAVMLLEEEAPLGVSVDLDDVSMEFVDRTLTDEDDEEGEVVLLASLPSASLLRLDDGSWSLTATTTAEWTASGAALSRTATGTHLLTGKDGRVPAAAVRAALGPTGLLTASAGDRDSDEGTVVHSERAGDLLMRVTRARLRGATLVAMPAYDRARIVLDDPPEQPPEDVQEPDELSAAMSEAHRRVIDYVQAAPVPVGARDVARALGMRMETARGHLGRAAKNGHVVRLSRGLYIGPATQNDELAASASGDLDLPVHKNPDRTWDGDAARPRVLAWATGEDDEVDAAKLSSAFLYRDDDADPATVGAYKLPFADVVDGRLEIIAAAVYTIAAVLQGGRGGADIPADEEDTIRGRVETLYRRIADAYDDDSIVPPWKKDEDSDATAAGMRELEASAWSAMADTDPLPAAWFREPTEEELPPGSGGVHYAAGRIYGWVAQAGEPHAGFPGRHLTIDSLGDIDLSHFLRARFKLDDGTLVKAGAFTMNVPHHRDGAECESAACQFDDSRTVAGIVTVGMNKRGLWFSGAAAPWLSEWDRHVFAACQPSYHMKQSAGGRWQLRAVLSVPVPGHSSPLLATAVAERANLALAASAASATLDQADVSGHGSNTGHPTAADLPGQRPDTSGQPSSGSGDVDTVAAALLTSDSLLDVLLEALDRRQEQREEAARAEAAELASSVIDPARAEITASAAGDAATATEGEA